MIGTNMMDRGRRRKGSWTERSIREGNLKGFEFRRISIRRDRYFDKFSLCLYSPFAIAIQQPFFGPSDDQIYVLRKRESDI